jgi:RimJ/RimL family protein N-acetyltransferase
MPERISFLKGNLVSFHPLEFEAIPKLSNWLNTEIVTHFMFYGQRPKNLEQISEEIKSQINSPHNIVFLISENSSDEQLGFGGLYDIHLTARKAELRILIGEYESWGKGYGTEATELLLFYGFDRLNLNRIWLGVTDGNKRALKAYEKCGFQVEGKLKNDIYRNSRYYDSIRMAIMRKDYYPVLFEKHRKKFIPDKKLIKK